jgi:asparagine synthase (glutamine-hydrolysing)
MRRMCGIAALLDPAGTVPAEAGRKMMAALHHRGPDGQDIRTSGPASLIHTRLAIIDVAGGDQPLDSEDGRCSVIVNGEIYNHLDVRRGLEARGHRFATRSDSEVVVHGYEEHGADSVRALNGIFAFALWDAREQRLFAARDPFGVKPLYWWTDGRRLALASEVGALLASGLVQPRIDPVALDHYLACRFVPGTRTLFEGVSKLPPAATLTATPDGPVEIASYREAPGEKLPAMEAELETELARRFCDAVERQMMSDVPYGAFLSGGVDSAAITAAMRARSAAPPTTFTIGFPGHGEELDERGAARQAATAIGTDHHDTSMQEGDFLGELRRCVVRLEEPCGIPSAPALMQLSRFAAKSVKVVLSGQGADEPHGGYGRHQAAALLGAISHLPRGLASPAQRLAGALPRNERAKRAARLMGHMPDSDRLVRLVEITDDETRSALTGGPGERAAAERSELARDLLSDIPDRNFLERALYLDTHLFLPSSLLICGDKMSMASSLEQRVPFLDVELMRFVERVPARQRVRLREGKRLHRRAMSQLLPADVMDRPRHGFYSPWDQWLHTSLGDEVRSRYDGGDLGELIEPAEVDRLVAAHRSGRGDHKWILFCLLELSEWHRAFIQGEAGAELQPAAEPA